MKVGIGATPPKHYDLKPEPIDVIEGWGLGYHLGNVIKYISRAGKKGSRLEDLEKAADSLAREIEREKVWRAEYSAKLDPQIILGSVCRCSLCEHARRG